MPGRGEFMTKLYGAPGLALGSTRIPFVENSL